MISLLSSTLTGKTAAQKGHTFGFIVDPGVDFICCPLCVSEIEAPALTLEIGFVGGYKGLLHGEALLRKHGVGDGNNVLV